MAARPVACPRAAPAPGGTDVSLLCSPSAISVALGRSAGGALIPRGKDPREGRWVKPRERDGSGMFCCRLLRPRCPSADKQWQGLGMPFKA